MAQTKLNNIDTDRGQHPGGGRRAVPKKRSCGESFKTTEEERCYDHFGIEERKKTRKNTSWDTFMGSFSQLQLQEDGVGCELYSFNKEIEQKICFDKHSTEKWSCTTKTMRSILVDWLVLVHHAHSFSVSSLFLAVSILDRYYAATGELPQRNSFQAHGIACLLLATKYHESRPLRIQECVTYTAGSCTAEQVLKVESKILSTIGFRLAVPTVHTFVQIFLSTSSLVPDAQNLTAYISEMCLYEAELLKFAPSLVALSAIFLALSPVGASESERKQTAWEETGKCSNYRMDDFEKCMAAIKGQLKSTIYTRSHRKLEAVDRKYPSARAKLNLAD
uniref:Uncharacterized protein n=1 Tax=Heterosigma akashiwo TaxID=2829 RepID=A0A6V1NEH1_HETAK|eukprot:CAMPEP_0206387228 /NCGR_PEP_ID=MMETSP0294-20121207/16469_1 /ASSEMBLY_ACC=CAM_ASM_000327 /TAXON_ID=39354 /ORGANISM="Heterosigma akashiwo, Strain CCMP2393" /LENGTH=333 /DNA_ID=CAMNT_0053838537 /DNA_START=27 /DNA_END=1028 /DNA_ORIENTATION=-